MGEHQQRDAELAFDQLEAPHQGGRRRRAKSAGHEPRDVVHDDDVHAPFADALVDRREHKIGVRTILGRDARLPRDLGPQDAGGKIVALGGRGRARTAVGVAVVKLAVRHLKIEHQDALRPDRRLKWPEAAAAHDRLGDLDREEALADARVGEHYRQVVFTPERAEEALESAAAFGDPQPFVDRADLEQIGPVHCRLEPPAAVLHRLERAAFERRHRSRGRGPALRAVVKRIVRVKAVAFLGRIGFLGLFVVKGFVLDDVHCRGRPERVETTIYLNVTDVVWMGKTRDKRQGTRDERQETRDKRQETRDKRRETRGGRRETGDGREGDGREGEERRERGRQEAGERFNIQYSILNIGSLVAGR